MRIVFRPGGQQNLIKSCRKLKPMTTNNNMRLKIGKAEFGKLRITRRAGKNCKIITKTTKKVVPATFVDEFKSQSSSKDLLSSSTSLISKSPSSSSLIPTSPSLESIISGTSSPPPLLQTLPSPTDEFKSWSQSSSSSEIDNDVHQQQQQPSQENREQNQQQNEKRGSVAEVNRNHERPHRIINVVTAPMNEYWPGRIVSFDTTFVSNPPTGRLTQDNLAKILAWQKYKERFLWLSNLHKRQNRSSSVTPSRPQSGNGSDNNANGNESSISSNGNSSNGVNSINFFHASNNSNNNTIGIGHVNNGGGIKRAFVQDDPNEPEPTSSENIKRIKVNGGYQNVAVLDDRYIFICKIEGTSFYYCIDARAGKRLMCKVSLDPCTKLIEAHIKLNGHPCISQLQRVIRKDNKTYMFFPMVQDDLLSYVRRRKRIPERDARSLFRQMCAIVRACHNQGIVLRDLKLRKFILSDGLRKHLKLESLVDAVVLDDPTNDLLKEKRGCPVYVAPEILKTTQTYCGKAADMWSLGVILYTMLIGRYPFSDTEHAALFAKISRGQFALPDIITPKARCIIRCLLRQEPEERITSEDIFYHPWMIVNDATEINLSNTDQCVPTNDYIGKDNCGNSNNINNNNKNHI